MDILDFRGLIAFLDLREVGANAFGKTRASVDGKVEINRKVLFHLPEIF